jgi:hypothetical protein
MAERVDLWIRPTTLVYQSVELDYSPGWKQALGEAPFTLTAWSLGTNFQIERRIWATVALDSRRPLVQPEQRLLPTPAPLDRYSGVYASARYELSANQSVRVGGAVRRRDRDGRTYESWDVGLSSRRLLAKMLSGGVHAFGYNDGPAQGVNADADLSARVRPWSTLDLSGGLGATIGDAGVAAVPDYRSRWIRGGLDLLGPQGSWLRVGHEWQGGGPGNEFTAEFGLTF